MSSESARVASNVPSTSLPRTSEPFLMMPSVYDLAVAPPIDAGVDSAISTPRALGRRDDRWRSSAANVMRNSSNPMKYRLWNARSSPATWSLPNPNAAIAAVIV